MRFVQTYVDAILALGRETVQDLVLLREFFSSLGVRIALGVEAECSCLDYDYYTTTTATPPAASPGGGALREQQTC